MFAGFQVWMPLVRTTKHLTAFLGKTRPTLALIGFLCCLGLLGLTMRLVREYLGGQSEIEQGNSETEQGRSCQEMQLGP